MCKTTKRSTHSDPSSYYVKAILRRGRVIGYGVYQCVGGVEYEHDRFPIADYAADSDGALNATLLLANLQRDDLNAQCAEQVSA